MTSLSNATPQLPAPNCVLPKLSVAAGPAADGAVVGAVAEPMHLHTSVNTVKYTNVALAFNRDAAGIAELSVT